MLKKILISLVSAGMFASATAAETSADEARLLRFPATNGTEVAFSYAGDLYTAPLGGGQARRLTSHIGYEMFARYSPDGKTIAFTGEYDGNREVYTMPSQGGEPLRLSFTSTNGRDDLGDRMGPNNIVMGWTPDGTKIIYRNRIGDGFGGLLYTIDKEGGMPTEIKLPEGGFCSYSPDGKRLAYNRVMREFRTWKYYRGGMADDVWIYAEGKNQVTDITNNDAQDIFPMWVGDEIYFASDRDMIMNIFVYDTRTKQTRKVTDYKDYDVKFPSTNGEMIVYEHAGYLYKLDPATKQSTQIHITLSSDDIYARTERKDVKSILNGISIPGNGERMALTARGEVFDVPVGQGVTRNITNTPGAQERDAEWSPDGKHIAYISDITGETEIWLQNIKGGKPEQITRDNDTYIRGIQWSPDSKTLLYTDRENRVVTIDIASRSKKVIMRNPEAEFRDVDFSPDSKWLTYTKPASNNMGVVYVYNIEKGKEYEVTDKWYNSDAPTFSSDGKYLLFSSDRSLHPTYSWVEWNYAYNKMGGMYMALLAKDTKSPMLPTDEEVKLNEKAKDEKSKDTAKDKEDNTVRIDPEGLSERIISIPLGDARVQFCDGKKVYYRGSVSGAQCTMAFDFKTQKSDKVTDGLLFAYNFGSKKAIFSKAGEWYVGDFPASHVNLADKADKSHLVATVDYSQEWLEIFDAVWRAFRDGYYQENMNGRDWTAIKAKYAVFLPYVKTRLDLNYVIGEMIGEVATGHCYINPGEKPEAKRIPMGLLGAKISPDKSGYFRIDEILKGAPYTSSLRAPLCEPGMDVKEGEYITAIDGIDAKSVKNIYSLLIGKANVLTELTVNGSAAEGGRKVIVKPISDEYPLYHYKWVQKNIKLVEEKTGGKVGYIYIPDMGMEGLNEFVRYYYPQLDKQALIIDDRANGGGNVSPMIIERLKREVISMTMSRGSTKNETEPDGTQTGPKIMLVNKYSASDGDLFPWRFQTSKMGTVIGTRTWGGIIGISGSLTYMDGTDVRVPFFTNYDAKTGKWVVENHGVDPDIVLDNDPVKEYNGEDQQLEKAIEVALEQIKNWKPLPSTPAPRTFKDLNLEQPNDNQYLPK
ncbi:MAG: S41 family peptidase [Bacteroidales bacterium]